MPERIDPGDDDSREELEEALRQLERRGAAERAERGKSSEADREAEKRRLDEQQETAREQSREELEDAVVAIRERQRAARRREVSPWAAGIRWALLAAAAIGLLAALFLSLRPEPLPPPAASPQAAVSSFWDLTIQEKYASAVCYYPSMIDRYGSRRQAGMRLKSYFRDDLPVRISAVGEAAPMADSNQLLVSYEVYMRSGRPRSGEAVVADSGSPETGYVIVSGI